jgi:hypothetical protein
MGAETGAPLDLAPGVSRDPASGVRAPKEIKISELEWKLYFVNNSMNQTYLPAKYTFSM